MLVRRDIPLAPLTTLRLGGSAARMADVEREDDVVEAVREAERAGDALWVLGGGSNVVVPDEGVAGLVVRMAVRGVQVMREARVERAGKAAVVVDVGAGEDWDVFVARAVDEGWTGIECMSGIPGRVGATPIQNVGAYGQEVSETIASVRAYDRDAGAFVEIDPAACRFAYRDSVFKASHRWIVTRVRFALTAGASGVDVRYGELSRALAARASLPAPAGLVRETVLALRRSKGMVVDPADPDSVSAGSFFVNPVVDAATAAEVRARAGEAPPSFDAGEGRFKLAAAWLVERAGFPRGWGEGPIGVSRKHALALVHRGGGTTRELVVTARAIRERVRARFGVELQPEPVFFGGSWDAP